MISPIILRTMNGMSIRVSAASQTTRPSFMIVATSTKFDHFIEPVRNIENRRAFGFQPFEETVQLRDLGQT